MTRASNSRVDRAKALELLHALGDHPRITADDGTVLELPQPVLDALAELLKAAANGERALVLRSPGDLTTEQAAAVLGVSRPTVVRLVEAGKLPARLVGTHRRLALGDVLAYREAPVAKRRTALDEMTADAEELGLYGLTSHLAEPLVRDLDSDRHTARSEGELGRCLDLLWCDLREVSDDLHCIRQPPIDVLRQEIEKKMVIDHHRHQRRPGYWV